MSDHDNTADKATDPLFTGAEHGNIDNDAYGRTEDETPADNPEEEFDENDPDEDDSLPPAGDADESDEEDEFYWDGKPLESPTSKAEREAGDSPLIKQLRQTIKDQRAQLRDKNIALPTPQTTAQAPASLPPKPTLEDEDVSWDTDAYEKKLASWYEQKAQFEAQQQQSVKQQEALQTTFNEKKQAYKDRIGKLRVHGYDDAEALVAESLPQEVQAAFIMHAERPELIVLALSRNPELMERAKKITDPVSLGVLIGDIQVRAKAMPKGKSTAKGVPAAPRGKGAPAGGLDAARERAQKTGDYTEYHRLKRQQDAKPKK